MLGESDVAESITLRSITFLPTTFNFSVTTIPTTLQMFLCPLHTPTPSPPHHTTFAMYTHTLHTLPFIPLPSSHLYTLPCHSTPHTYPHSHTPMSPPSPPSPPSHVPTPSLPCTFHTPSLSPHIPTHPHTSLVPTPRTPPGEKRSGERSRISWAYSPKWWKTNEIARSLIIT